MTFRTDVSNGDGTEMHRELPLPQGEVEREAAEHAICGSPLCCVARKRATPTFARVPLVDGLTCLANSIRAGQSGADDGNRTRVFSLGSRFGGFTIVFRCSSSLSDGLRKSTFTSIDVSTNVHRQSVVVLRRLVVEFVSGCDTLVTAAWGHVGNRDQPKFTRRRTMKLRTSWVSVSSLRVLRFWCVEMCE